MRPLNISRRLLEIAPVAPHYLTPLAHVSRNSWRRVKGYVAPQHKHLTAAHTFIIKGKLAIRDGILATGDYTYEQNGMIHGATTAL
jgi:anti-sigma factor ChrR (cupin superfamily)